MDLDLTLQPFAIVSDRLEALVRAAVALLPNIAAALVVVLLTAIVAFALGAGVKRTFTRSRARPALAQAMRQLARSVTWIVGLLIAATIVFPNLTPANAIAGLGVGSLVAGLAFKDVFENFLAGFLILVRKPMRIGDDIACEGVEGQVEDITIRDTLLRKRSGELVLVPNSFLFKNPLLILTDRELRRIEVVVGVAYGENVDAAREVIAAALQGLATVADRPVQVFATGFGSSSIDFTVRWWTGSTPIDEQRSRDVVVAAIKAGLDDAGIEIPFPYRTLTFKEPMPAMPIRHVEREAGHRSG